MRRFHVLLLIMLTSLLCSCTGLMRGLSNNSFASNAFPPVLVSVDMPLITEGVVSPYLFAMGGYRIAEGFVTVYGTNEPNSPVAIVALCDAPEHWQWDISPDIVYRVADSGKVTLGDKEFSALTYIATRKKDPFAPVMLGETEQWLVRRYSMLVNFRQSKLILEYREPMPAGLDEENVYGPYGAQLPAVVKIAANARAAFTVMFVQPDKIQSMQWNKVLDTEYLDKFFGKISPKDPYILNY